MDWTIVYYHVDVQNAILAFPEGLQARYIHLTARLQTFGPDLGMPHTRSLGKGLFELRAKAREGISRVLFGILEGRRIMMLHAFVKKTQKTPAKEIKIARTRLKDALSHEDSRESGANDAEKPGRSGRV